MTVVNNNNTSDVICTGLTITRESVPSLAARLADNLFYYTRDYYRYRSEDSAKKDFAETIGIYIHIMLNQLGVDKRECEYCDAPQADHDRVGGYCSGGNHRKFKAKGAVTR